MARSFATLSALTLCVAACAFPGIDFRPADEDDGGSASTGGGMGGMPGVGGGMGGVLTGGAGGSSTCIVGAPGQCPEGQKCSVDPTTGEVGCLTAGNRPAWTRCFSDADCASGTFCDGPTKVCHPVCDTAAQCTSQAAQCLPAKNDTGRTLANVKVCTSDCNPLDGNPCDDTFGKTTCFYDVGNALWDCAQTKGMSAGASCSGFDDCDRGLVCMASGLCREWCTPVGSTCSLIEFTFCEAPSNIEPVWSGTPIGVCL